MTGRRHHAYLFLFDLSKMYLLRPRWYHNSGIHHNRHESHLFGTLNYTSEPSYLSGVQMGMKGQQPAVSEYQLANMFR